MIAESLAVVLMAVSLVIGLASRRRISKDTRIQSYNRTTGALVDLSHVVSWIALAAAFALNHYGVGILSPSTVLKITGSCLMVAGIAIRLIAMRTLGKFFSSTLFVERDHRLVTKGLYSRIRHPIYLGDLLFLVSIGLAVSNYIVLLAIALTNVPAYLYRLSIEEKMLKENLGGAYESYCRRTKRLLPFIY